MTRIAGAVVFALATAACGVGGGDDGGGTNPPPQPKPIDDGELCSAHFTITSGTFTPGTTPRPTDPDTMLPITGCWPVGQWSFTATVDSNTCATAPTSIPYSFKVERVAATDGGTDTTQVLTNQTSLTASAAVQAHLSMSSNGQGCEGSLELASADGTKYWNMKPTLSKDPADRVLHGGGDYDEYKVDAWPWKGQ